MTALPEFRLPWRGATTENIVRLAGDASNRSYYRLHLRGAPCQTAIAMILAEEHFGKSGEIETGVESTDKRLPFVQVQELLHRSGWRVPEIYTDATPEGYLLLADLGEIHLMNLVHDAQRIGDETLVTSLYEKAVDMLVEMQIVHVPDGHLIRRKGFSADVLAWEFMHYFEYAIQTRLPESRWSKVKAPAEAAFKKLAAELAASPTIICHRDYHSRNLLHYGDKFWAIDFQDALMGPIAYDLASLLRDAYVRLPATLRRQMAERFRRQAVAAMVLKDDSTFEQGLMLCGLQRNLKVIGRFEFFAQAKNKPGYLADIPYLFELAQEDLELLRRRGYSVFDELIGMGKEAFALPRNS